MGRLKFEETEFKRHWYGNDNNGIAIIAEPKMEFYANTTIEKDENFFVLRQLISKITKQRVKLFLAIMLLVISAGCNWIIPLFYQRVIDKGVLGHDISIV